MSTIKETTLHPDGNEGVDLYPKTNINQVQELPQKLMFVETQINQLNIDKLTKPANPSAESAVTMLADGTVGTKLLSEIGGKLYAHNLRIEDSSFSILNITYLHTSNSETTNTEELSRMFNAINNQIGTINGSAYICVNEFSLPNIGYFKFSDGSTGTFVGTSIISHTVTEL